jgi:hypothetical protein
VTRHRYAVYRAADAPAPSIVLDAGGCVPDHADHLALRAFVECARRGVIGAHPDIDGLGVKTILIFPPALDQVRVEFFQGDAHGELMPASAAICLNSLSCALTVGSRWYPELAVCDPVVASMGGREYVMSRAVA